MGPQLHLGARFLKLPESELKRSPVGPTLDEYCYETDGRIAN